MQQMTMRPAMNYTALRRPRISRAPPRYQVMDAPSWFWRRKRRILGRLSVLLVLLIICAATLRVPAVMAPVAAGTASVPPAAAQTPSEQLAGPKIQPVEPQTWLEGFR